MEEKGLIMWISIMLNDSVFALDTNTIKGFTLVSHSIANSLKNYIEQNYWFDLRNGRRLTHYSPRNQKSVTDFSEITPTTTKIITSYSFNKQITKEQHFPNLTRMSFGFRFNMPVDSLLPPSLTHLEFKYHFNFPVSALPAKLTHLTLSYMFCQDVNSLPHSLTHLRLGHCFDLPVPSLPPNLILLAFGTCFNRTVPHLPRTSSCPGSLPPNSPLYRDN
eukprot:TRINITY_DN3324_c0_g2_i1.p1 TRINITY_DN3324_c0_g2~~TRINITY_DN3324_c0_g2_i1.p1  ORF type:complete len:234 (-),score=56.09 TRINITY_DN3324_c0_g2_i1:488-1144(-)